MIRGPSETTPAGGYIHGYRRREQERLDNQAGALVDLLHAGTAYPPGTLVLEVGCGVGSQTLTLARRSPETRFVSVDVSADSVSVARRRIVDSGMTNVDLYQADVFALPFRPASFDHAFVCFVLEHLSRPREALEIVRRLLRPGGTVTVVEGDHGSAFFHPDSEAARAVIACQVELQRRAGGDALIGRRLSPLLADAGYASVEVTPRNVYVDASRPDLVEGFTRRTFTAMIDGVRVQALAAGLLSPDRFDAGVRALQRTAETDGVFSYAFFKATATTPGPVSSPRNHLA
ncbi:MAG TPA: methyltransferase domain-containing protein [Acidimicrobiales bacterium]